MEMEPGLVDVLAHERSLMLEISNQLPFQSLVTCHFLFKRIYGRQACSTHNCTCQIRYKITNSETVTSMTPNHSILPILNKNDLYKYFYGIQRELICHLIVIPRMIKSLFVVIAN